MIDIQPARQQKESYTGKFLCENLLFYQRWFVSQLTLTATYLKFWLNKLIIYWLVYLDEWSEGSYNINTYDYVYCNLTFYNVTNGVSLVADIT